MFTWIKIKKNINFQKLKVNKISYRDQIKKK